MLSRKTRKEEGDVSSAALEKETAEIVSIINA